LTNPNIVDIEDEEEVNEDVKDDRDEDVKNISQQQHDEEPAEILPRKPVQAERNPGSTPRRLTVLSQGRARNENAQPELDLVQKRPEEALFESISKGNKVSMIYNLFFVTYEEAK
jgi:hypothetical protein